MNEIKEIKVKNKNKNYSIIIGSLNKNILNTYIKFEDFSQIILLTEEKIYNLWVDFFEENLSKNIKIIKIKTGEGEKNIKNAEYVWREMINFNLDRKSLLINFGGGMISDLGGFIASTYMRGVEYINIPTTLLAMVDASIGGKTAINLGEIKNIIGCFSSPNSIFIDIRFLSTLAERELNSAKAEMIKHAIIKDENYFRSFENTKNVNNKNELLELIEKSIEIKRNIVEEDFEEKNIRKILNFGHTIGHAFEALSLKTKNPLLHGEAIAIGILVESTIALNLDILKKEEYKRIENCINLNFKELFSKKPQFKIQEILNIIRKDKKNEFNKLKFALPNKIGNCLHDIEVENEIIENSLSKFYQNAI